MKFIIYTKCLNRYSITGWMTDLLVGGYHGESLGVQGPQGSVTLVTASRGDVDDVIPHLPYDTMFSYFEFLITK